MSAVAIEVSAPRPRLSAVAGIQPWRDAALLFLALFAITLPAWFADERLLNDVSVWSKPLKFQASLALHFATLALLARLLPEARRRTRSFNVIVGASAAAGLFEIAYIMLQAARGRASHFNDQTLLEIVMYGLMGFGSLLLVAAPLVMGVWLLRGQGRRRAADPLRLGAALGLILSAVSTLIVAGYMSSHGGHWVGNAASDAPGLPILGWSQQVGDLRAAHFFATHAMQLLPLAGWLLRDAGRPGRRRLLAGSAAYTVFIAAVFVQALLGQPFLRLSG